MIIFAFMLACLRLLGSVASKIDRALDGTACALGAVTLLLGSLARLTHTGRIQQYLTFALIGVIVAVAWLTFS